MDERNRKAGTLAGLKTERAALGAKSRQIETEAAPIRYVAELIGADADSERAIRWLIALIVLCRDPRHSLDGCGSGTAINRCLKTTFCPQHSYRRFVMTRKTKTSAREQLDAELLEMAQAYRGSLLRAKTADKITMRILGDKTPPKPTLLSPDEIRTIREDAHMSQAVFASVLNITTGYLSQLERGARQPTGAALAMLHVIRRKGIETVL